MPDTLSAPIPATALPSPALVRIPPAQLGSRRDRRPVYVANLRWLNSAQDKLTAAEIAHQAANHGATWKVERPGVFDHFALAPDLIHYDDSVPLRDRVKPLGAPSIAALLATLVPPGSSAVFVHPVDLVTPLDLAVYIDETTVIAEPRRPGDTLWLVVTVIDGRITASDMITLAGGGDLLVTEDQATDLLIEFRNQYPAGDVYTIPERKLKQKPNEHTEPLDHLLIRATALPTLAGRLTHFLPWTKRPVLTPVKTASLARAKPLIRGALALTALYLVTVTVPTLYREGRLPFMTPPPPPKPEYTPPPAPAAFTQPLPSAWIAACINALDDLYRPIQGYTPGQSSCTAPSPGRSMPMSMSAGGTGANAAFDGVPGDPPPPYGRAAIAYTPLPAAKAGHLRDIKLIFASKPATQNEASPPIGIQEPAAMDRFVAHRSLLPPPGQKPHLRGLHALMRADALRRYLLDLRRTACLAITVDPLTDTQSALLSPPGAPYAVAPVGRMKITITSAMSPSNLSSFLDSIPGLILTAVKRSFDDSATLGTGNSDPSRPDTKDAKDAAKGGSAGSTPGRNPGQQAGGDNPTKAFPEFVGCDHPTIPSLATWTLEAQAYALQ